MTKTTLASLVLAAALLAGCSGNHNVVAVVNGDRVTVEDVGRALPRRVDSTENMDSVRSRALNSVINKKLLVQEALRQGLDTAIEYQLEMEKKSILTGELYNSVVEAGNRLTDLELQGAHKLLQTEVHLRVIAVKDEMLARSIEAELANGVPFETLAARYSTHATGRASGDVGFVSPAMLDEPVRHLVVALKPGEHTKPTYIGERWQLIQLVESRPSANPPPPLKEFRQELEARLKQQRRREIAQQYIADLRSRLVFNPAGLHVLMKPLDSITEADQEVWVAIKDGSKYVKVSRLLKVAARFPAYQVDTVMKQYAVKREVEEDLIYQDALDRKLDVKPEVQRQFERKREDLLYQALYRREITDKLNVTDEAVRQYYDENRDNYPDPDFKAAAGIIRSRLLNERRDVRYREYLAELRGPAKVTVNESVLKRVVLLPVKDKKT